MNLTIIILSEYYEISESLYRFYNLLSTILFQIKRCNRLIMENMKLKQQLNSFSLCNSLTIEE